MSLVNLSVAKQWFDQTLFFLNLVMSFPKTKKIYTILNSIHNKICRFFMYEVKKMKDFKCRNGQINRPYFFRYYKRNKE